MWGNNGCGPQACCNSTKAPHEGRLATEWPVLATASLEECKSVQTMGANVQGSHAFFSLHGVEGEFPHVSDITHR